MFDTSDSVPRQEGSVKKLMTKLSRKSKTVHRFQSGQKLLQFATGDFLRKYLVNEPYLARKGEPGYDPNVEAEVQPALRHSPRMSAKSEKMIKSEESKRWRPRKGYKTRPAGSDIVADAEGSVPGTSAKGIKAGIFKQLKDITLHPPTPPPPPPEMLPDHPVGKTKIRGMDYEGRPNIQDLWDPKEAAKPTAVKETPNLELRKRTRIPRNEAERIALKKRVSKGAEAFRDPIASHLARVKIGATPNLLEHRESRIPGVPSQRLKPAQETLERHRAQGIRDILAEKGWAYRKNVLKPLRAYAREQAGQPPVQPITNVKHIHQSADAMGNTEIGKPGQVSKVSPKPNISVGKKQYAPGVLKNLQNQFEKDIGKRLGVHTSAAKKIRKDIEARVHASASPMKAGREIEEEAMTHVKSYFDPGRKDPLTKIQVHQAAAFTGYSEDEIKTLHKAFRRHTYLGETQKGENLLRRQVFPRSLKKVPATLEPVASKAASSLSPILKRTAIGAGIAGAVGAGAYLVHKMRKRKAEQKFHSWARLVQFEQIEDAYTPPTPWHQKEVRRWLRYPESRSRALEQTIGKVQRIHHDLRAQKTKTGEIIDAKGRERQPEWRKPWFKRTLITTGIVGTALAGRGIYGKLKRASQVAGGLMEKKLPISATERLAANVTSGNLARAIGSKFPKMSSIGSSISRHAGSFGERFKQETKALKEGAANKINKAIEGQVGEITGGKLIRNKQGVVTKVAWDNPAYLKENMDKARKIQERGAQIIAQGKSAEQRAARAGQTRASLEEDLKRRDKELSSILRLIRFQEAVPVRQHYRSPRSSQPRSKQKNWQQGLLIGVGGTAALGGTAYGTKWGWDRYASKLSREEAAKQSSNAVDAIIKKRESEILGGTVKKVARASKKIIRPAIFHGESLLHQIRFSAFDNLRQKLAGPDQESQSPTHDIAIGAIEGGLTFPASAYAAKKLLGPSPTLARKMLVGGAVGGAATGLVGIGLAKILRGTKQIKKQRQENMSSKIGSIQFQAQRTLVARDRYMKQVHEQDTGRANTYYVRTGVLGAGIGALSKGKLPIGKKALIGAGVGLGVQKLARMYGASTKDQFGERSWNGKRVEKAPELLGTAGLGIAAVRHLQKLKKLSSKSHMVKFEEPKRKHNIAAGLAVAAAGIPLYKGAGKFARIGLRSKIDKFAGKSHNYGKQVADYIEASQHVLNQGITGKLTGMALRNPKAPVVKHIIGKGPSVLGELGSAKSGLNKASREHFSSFRSSPTGAFQAWSEEYHGILQNRLVKSTSVDQFKARQKDIVKHQTQTEKVMAHIGKLSDQGYNEREALRHVSQHPAYGELFKNLAGLKAAPVKNYSKLTAGLAAVPAAAGAAVASTTRKNRDLSARLDAIINFEEKEKRNHFPKAAFGVGAVTGAGIATGNATTRSLLRPTVRQVEKLWKHIKGLR